MSAKPVPATLPFAEAVSVAPCVRVEPCGSSELTQAGPRLFLLRVAAGHTIALTPGCPLSAGRGGNRMEEKLLRALPRDVPDYHERQAAHFRALASTATTARVKTRLLREADEHEQ